MFCQVISTSPLVWLDVFVYVKFYLLNPPHLSEAQES